MTLTPSPSADDFDNLARALYFAWRASRHRDPHDPVGYQADFLKGYARRIADRREEGGN
jgi:hypothetical protein